MTLETKLLQLHVLLLTRDLLRSESADLAFQLADHLLLVRNHLFSMAQPEEQHKSVCLESDGLKLDYNGKHPYAMANPCALLTVEKSLHLLQVTVYGWLIFK